MVMEYIDFMEIGEFKLKSRAVMAPIAGMTDAPFRKIVMEYGAGMVTSELISANALVRDSAKTFLMLPSSGEPRPSAIQIFGGEADTLKEAALLVEERGHCNAIDLNFGCPVKKVTKCGAGSAMSKDLKKAEKVVSTVADAIKLPLTVKIRIGWNSSSVNGVEMAKTVEGAGASAITVHGRTASQGYSGESDWDVISKIASCIKIPVIGNGDITTPEIALHRLDTSGCFAIMIGRGALGAPWIFRQVDEILATGSYTPVTMDERLSTAISHIGLMESFYGDKIAARKLRAVMSYYSKGLRNGSKFRELVNKALSCSNIHNLTEHFFVEHDTALAVSY